MAVFNHMGQQNGWLLMNVHSLGRLGLSSKEIEEAAKEDRLHVVVEKKLEVIRQFNEAFREVERVAVNAPKKEDGAIPFGALYYSLLNLGNAAARHPNEEIQKIIKEAAAPFSKLTGLEDQVTIPPSLIDEVRRKLEEADGIGPKN